MIDSGWKTLTDTEKYRAIGNIGYVSKNDSSLLVSGNYGFIGTLPVGFRPFGADINVAAVAYDNTNNSWASGCAVQIQTSGQIVFWASPEGHSFRQIRFSASFPTRNGV